MPIPESFKPFLKLSLPVIAVGALAGMFGAIASGTYLIHYSESLLQTNVDSTELSQTKPKPLPGSVDEALANVRRSVAPAVVQFYPKFPLGHAVLPGTELGVGVVVTSDGWVATTSEVAPDSAPGFVVQIGDDTYDTDSVYYDRLTQLTMVHLVSASGLPVVPFGDSQTVQGGEAVYVVVDEDVIIPTAVVNSHQSVMPSVAFAEAFTTNLALADQVISPSAIVANSSGEFIALTLTKTEGAAGGVGALPIHQILNAIKSLIRSNELSRAYLGASLNRSTNEAVVSQVAIGSPAAAAGLQKADVITHFAEVALSEKQSLADLIASYNPGDKVQLVVNRAGSVVQIEVELGKE